MNGGDFLCCMQVSNLYHVHRKNNLCLGVLRADAYVAAVDQRASRRNFSFTKTREVGGRDMTDDVALRFGLI